MDVRATHVCTGLISVEACCQHARCMYAALKTLAFMGAESGCVTHACSTAKSPVCVWAGEFVRAACCPLSLPLPTDSPGQLTFPHQDSGWQAQHEAGKEDEK